MSSVLSRYTLTRRAGLKALLHRSRLDCRLRRHRATQKTKTIKVGIMGGEDEDVWKVVAEEAAKHGLNIERVTFNDYNQPNEALERKEIDANAFQHKPYLDEQVKQHGYKISVAGYTAVWPIGIYSRKHKSSRRTEGRRIARRAERSVKRRPRPSRVLKRKASSSREAGCRHSGHPDRHR